MSEQGIKNKLESLTNEELKEMCRLNLNKVCKNGMRSFTMCVPAQWSDTDMIFSEAFRRLTEK